MTKWPGNFQFFQFFSSSLLFIFLNYRLAEQNTDAILDQNPTTKTDKKQCQEDVEETVNNCKLFFINIFLLVGSGVQPF